MVEREGELVRELLEKGFDRGIFRKESGSRRRDKKEVLDRFGFLVPL